MKVTGVENVGVFIWEMVWLGHGGSFKSRRGNFIFLWVAVQLGCFNLNKELCPG